MNNENILLKIDGQNSSSEENDSALVDFKSDNLLEGGESNHTPIINGNTTSPGSEENLSVSADGVEDDTPDTEEGGNAPIGSEDADILIGDEEDNHIEGRQGNDILLGRGGNDTLDGGEGHDSLNGEEGYDILDGKEGNDTLNGGEKNNYLNGGEGNDTLNNVGSGSTMCGEDGNDTLKAERGDNYLNGEQGNDILEGGKDGDILRGGEDHDVLLGKEGFDRLNGEEGNDILDGGQSVDMLNGDEGHDVLNGGEGDDILKGGRGYDIIDGGEGHDTVSFAYECDRVFLMLGEDPAGSSPITPDIQGSEQTHAKEGGTSPDSAAYEIYRSYSFPHYKCNGLSTIPGVDFPKISVAISSTKDDEDILADIGHLIPGVAYVNSLAEDIIRNTESIIGSHRNDILIGNSQNNVLRGGIGKDFLDGKEGSDWAAYSGNNFAPIRVALNGSEDAIVYEGGHAQDTIRNIENILGTFRDDVLIGDDKSNILDGYMGQDTFTGGGEADHFVFRVRGKGDLINDFSSSENDKIDVSLLLHQNRSLDFENGILDFSETTPKAYSIWYEASENENDIVVKADMDGDTTEEFSVILTGVTSLTTDDFILS